jgi:hypothetical protein
MAPEWLFPALKWRRNGAFFDGGRRFLRWALQQRATAGLLSADWPGFELMMESVNREQRSGTGIRRRVPVTCSGTLNLLEWECDCFYYALIDIVNYKK